MSRLAHIGVVALGLVLLAVPFAAAEEPRLVAAGDGVSALLPDGRVAWRVSLPHGVTPETPVWQGATVLLGSGARLDRFGGLLERICSAEPAAAPPGARPHRVPRWDEPAEITAPPPSGSSDAHRPPFFDSRGNAWVVLTSIKSGKYSLKARRSDGHDGTWGPLETLSDTTKYVAGPEAAIDHQDNITIAFRDISSGYRLYAIRYQPETGWGGLQQIYASSFYFQAIEAGADDAGNVVVLFDRESSGKDTVWSITYHAATGTWGTAQQVSPAGYSLLLPTLLRNRAGDAIYLVYLVTSGGSPGLYAQRWDRQTLSWGQAEFLPGSEVAGYSLAGPASRFPGTVDAQGNVTVFWENAYPGPYAPYASRCQDGTWQEAVQLLDFGKSVDVENFAGADVASTGDVFAVVTRFETGPNRMYAFRYDAEEGWQPAENPYTSTLSIATRVRVDFYQSEKAVATVLGQQDSVRQLTSLLHDGTAWLPDLVDIPGVEDAYYSDLASDRAEALLVYEAESGGNQGIKATFLRSTPGDYDEDGDVGLDDYAVFHDCLAGPGAEPAPSLPGVSPQDCRNAFDFDDDTDVDLADAPPLLAGFSG